MKKQKSQTIKLSEMVKDIIVPISPINPYRGAKGAYATNSLFQKPIIVKTLIKIVADRIDNDKISTLFANAILEEPTILMVLNSINYMDANDIVDKQNQLRDILVDIGIVKKLADNIIEKLFMKYVK